MQVKIAQLHPPQMSSGKLRSSTITLISLLAYFFIKQPEVRCRSTDHLQHFHVKEAPTRIVSANISADEILWEILKEAHQLDKLLGVSILADNPIYSNLDTKVSKIPFRIGGDIESLLKAKPDLVVLATFNRPELVRQIKSFKISTYTIKDLNKIDDIVDTIRDLSVILKEVQAGERVIQRFLSKIKPDVTTSTNHQKPKVFGWIGANYAVGTHTLFNDIVKYSGATNALAPLGVQGWVKLNSEIFLTLQPDVIVLSDQFNISSVFNELESDVSTRNWPAVKNKKYIVIANRDLNSASPYIANAIVKLKSYMKKFLGSHGS